MIKRHYLEVGPLPDYGNKGNGLILDVSTGMPILMESKRFATHNRGHTRAQVNPRLEGRICFYSVSEYGSCKLVALGDEERTRYYWFGKQVRKTYAVERQTTTFEGAWGHLFEAILFDPRQQARELHWEMGDFFKAMFKEPWFNRWEACYHSDKHSPEKIFVYKDNTCEKDFVGVKINNQVIHLRINQPFLPQLNSRLGAMK